MSFDFLQETRTDLHAKWDDATAREKRSRTVFAQETIKVDEVAGEVEAARAAIGAGVHVEKFVVEGLKELGAHISQKGNRLHFDLSELPRALREALGIGDGDKLQARFELPVEEGVLYLNRTHPMVEALAAYVMNSALDPLAKGVARRCGAIRTRQVDRRTTLLLVRFRYHLITVREDGESPLLAEECQLLGFAGAPDKAEWLEEKEAEKLLLSDPDANVHPDQASQFVSRIIEGFEHLSPKLDQFAQERASVLLNAHRRVRSAARLRGLRHRVEPHLPPDLLGIYVYLPVI